jgi:hypothetical protein
MKKKLMPVIAAVVLIIIIGCISFGRQILEKYSYSKDRADLDAYYQISDEEDTAIVLQDEMIEERARLIDGTYYLDFATVRKYFNDRFYTDEGEGLLLYTLPEDMVRVSIGSSVRETESGSEDMGYIIARYEGDTLYLAMDFVKQYDNFSYEVFTEPNRVQIYTSWPEIQTASIRKDTQVRVKGGVKSEI